MSHPTSRRNPAVISLCDGITMSYADMDYRVGEMQATLAECVHIAVKLWCGRFYRQRDNRVAELPSIVWELMRTAPAKALPSTIAYFACMAVCDNRHLSRQKLGTDVYGKNSGLRKTQIGAQPIMADQPDPADAVQWTLDMEAFASFVHNPNAKKLLQGVLEGMTHTAVRQRYGWTYRQQTAAAVKLRKAYERFHFPTTEVGEFVLDLLKAAYTAA